MKSIASAILVLVLASMAFAQPKVLDISTVADGTYIVRVSGDVVTIEPTKVITPGQPVPGPNPPGPVVLTDRGKAVRDASLRVVSDPKRAETAQGLAEIYRQIAAMCGNELKGDNIMLAVKMASDKFLGTPELKASWLDVRNLVGSFADTIVKQGATDQKYKDMLNECAAGYDASAPGKRISPELLAAIMKIIALIMQFFGH